MLNSRYRYKHRLPFYQSDGSRDEEAYSVDYEV